MGILLPASASLFPGAMTSSGARGRLVIALNRASNGVKMCCRVEHPVFNASYGRYAGPQDCRTFNVKCKMERERVRVGLAIKKEWSGKTASKRQKGDE